MKHLEDIETLLIECNEDLTELEKIKTKLIEIEENRLKLENYYDEQYLEDYDKYGDLKLNINVLDQDSIWNVLAGQYEIKKELLKQLAKSI